MGWGMDVTMYLSRVTPEELKGKREEAADMVEYYGRTILAMAASSGGEVEGEPWYSHVARELPQLLDGYREACLQESLCVAAIEGRDTPVEPEEIIPAPRYE